MPAALAGLAELRELNVENNRLGGAVPWVFRERAAPDGGLAMHYGGNAIAGLAPPPRAPAPTFPPDPAANGNAAHLSVARYQGPLVWEWDWRGDPVERQTPVLGRWAALAVRIEHATEEPPPVATRVLDGDGAVLAGRLSQAAPPSTEAAGPGSWQTEYVFELPGALHRAGNQVVHVIDPDNVMAETDETDNIGEPISLHGMEAPRLRITFFPVHPAGQEPPPLDAARLMRGIRALWPIPDDFEVTIAPPFETAAANQFELLADLRALWNAEADPDEFYFGIFDQPWTAGRGVAYRPGRVAVSEFSEFNTVPHEFGHNLDLRHTPGCGVLGPDWKYPYRNGGLGGMPGWDLNWRHRVSGEDDTYADIMSYCGVRQFVSDYNYRKVLGNWLETAAAQPAAATLHVVEPVGGSARLGPAGAGAGAGGAGAGGAGAGGGDAGAGGGAGGDGGAGGPSANGGESAANGDGPPTDTDRLETPPEAPGALALSGRIDAGGAWSLTHARQSLKGPRAPAPDGAHTLILLDAEGRELHREPLSAQALSHGEGGGWAARTPLPASPAREIVILDARGTAVLRQALPTD